MYSKSINTSQNNITSVVISYKSFWSRLTFLYNAVLVSCVALIVIFDFASTLSFYAAIDFIIKKYIRFLRSH